MRAVGTKPRTAQTLGGKVRYERTVFECPACRRSRAPLDEELTVASGDRLSLGVKSKAMLAGALESFGEAARILKLLAGIELSKAECERVALEEGERRDREQRAEEAKWLASVQSGQAPPEPEIAPERLVIQADAATVLTVKGEEHKSVYCAVAFDAADRQTKEGSGRPFLARKRYTASGQDMEDFGPKLKALGRRMGLRQAKSVAFIADGAACLWKWARENLVGGGREVVLIHDIWHVIERLYGLAADVWGENAEAKQRAARWKERLEKGEVAGIIEELEKERARRRGRKRKRLEEEIQYLRNGQERMDYPSYKEAGWPIGSGAVESACKNLIKRRFGIPGAHWRRKNIPKVAALRVDLLNADDFARDPDDQRLYSVAA
jgi:hypothetical protein